MRNRIKDVRKYLRMNQEDFGAKIGVTAPAICKWESGDRAIPESAIRSICREYGVNETWLRTGAGSMTAGKSREQEMAEMVKSLLAERPDSFRRAFVTTLLRFRPDGPEWPVLERIYEGIAREARQAGGDAEQEERPSDG